MTESKSKWEPSACLRCFCASALAMGMLVWMSARAIANERPAEAAVAAAEAGADRSANSIRANLASVAASAFEPAREGVVELAKFDSKPAVAVLSVPPPGSLSPVQPPGDHIPEPGVIGFGLAVAALIFGNFAKALMRCWKITNCNADRSR